MWNPSTWADNEWRMRSLFWFLTFQWFWTSFNVIRRLDASIPKSGWLRESLSKQNCDVSNWKIRWMIRARIHLGRINFIRSTNRKSIQLKFDSRYRPTRSSLFSWTLGLLPSNWERSIKNEISSRKDSLVSKSTINLHQDMTWGNLRILDCTQHISLFC